MDVSVGNPTARLGHDMMIHEAAKHRMRNGCDRNAKDIYSFELDRTLLRLLSCRERRMSNMEAL